MNDHNVLHPSFKHHSRTEASDALRSSLSNINTHLPFIEQFSIGLMLIGFWGLSAFTALYKGAQLDLDWFIAFVIALTVPLLAIFLTWIRAETALSKMSGAEAFHLKKLHPKYVQDLTWGRMTISLASIGCCVIIGSPLSTPNAEPYWLALATQATGVLAVYGGFLCGRSVPSDVDTNAYKQYLLQPLKRKP